MVITRSTVPGTGRYSGRWLGDNTSNWPHLRYSIIGNLDIYYHSCITTVNVFNIFDLTPNVYFLGMLEFNLFGIPFVSIQRCALHIVIIASKFDMSTSHHVNSFCSC